MATPAPTNESVILGPFFHTLLKAYGSFLYFRSPQSHWLPGAATLFNPTVGIMGLLGGITSLASRRLLTLPNQVYDLDVVNGVLLGLMVGTFFAPTPASIALTLMAGIFATLVSRLIHSAVVLPRGLPILSSPLFIVGIGLFAVGRALALPWAIPPAANPLDLLFYQWLPTSVLAWLISMGQIYFSPTPCGGLLVGLAILLSSRRLFLVIILAHAIVRIELSFLGVIPYSIPASLAGTAAMLTALMTGGVFARPGGHRPFVLAIIGALVVGIVSLAAYNVFYHLGLPPLSLAFVSTTWLIMIALSPTSGEPWSRYWLYPPQLPETVAETTSLAEARGVAEGSIGLRAPFFGTWQVYQGWNGPYTHQGEWRYALDFHQVIEGSAYCNDGHQLTDYYCFNAAICSPVSGQVTACRDDLPDNLPGAVDATNNWGNFILIALASGHHLLLAHLRQGSLTISPGTMVTPGQILARCGNSGRSPQPHLHLHVQTGPWLGNPTHPFHLTHVIVPGEPCILHLDHLPEERSSVQHPRPCPPLARALYRAVGRSFTYEMKHHNHPLELRVEIDLAGATWLVANTRASVAFVQTDTLVAFYRRHASDSSLNALLLTTALTPLCEETFAWNDAIPVGWLPTPWWLRLLNWSLPGILKGTSHYHRHWQPLRLCWEQTVQHRVQCLGKTLWSCHGSADLSESLGWVRFRLHTPRGVVQGELIRHGMHPDHGIAGWEHEIES